MFRKPLSPVKRSTSAERRVIYPYHRQSMLAPQDIFQWWGEQPDSRSYGLFHADVQT
jgi:hypothetical protein